MSFRAQPRNPTKREPSSIVGACIASPLTVLSYHAVFIQENNISYHRATIGRPYNQISLQVIADLYKLAPLNGADRSVFLYSKDPLKGCDGVLCTGAVDTVNRYCWDCGVYLCRRVDVALDKAGFKRKRTASSRMIVGLRLKSDFLEQ